MSWLGWYDSDGECLRYVRVVNGEGDAAMLKLVRAVLKGSDMYIKETDKRPVARRKQGATDE